VKNRPVPNPNKARDARVPVKSGIVHSKLRNEIRQINCPVIAVLKAENVCIRKPAQNIARTVVIMGEERMIPVAFWFMEAEVSITDKKDVLRIVT
jgi:hypothetical protein